jgi:1,6-anhydro-N-acetylmuramate kinase
MLAAESPSEVNCPTTRRVSSWAILHAHHPISVLGDARYNNRLESGVGKTPFQPATQSVYCISENETPHKDIICVNIDNMLCDTAQLMRAKGRNVKCPNHRGICTANLDRTDVIGNESR